MGVKVSPREVSLNLGPTLRPLADLSGCFFQHPLILLPPLKQHSPSSASVRTTSLSFSFPSPTVATRNDITALSSQSISRSNSLLPPSTPLQHCTATVLRHYHRAVV